MWEYYTHIDQSVRGAYSASLAAAAYPFPAPPLLPLLILSLEMFAEMKRHGVPPNEITFIGVLSSCRHMDLVNEARHHFQTMNNEHMIQPNVKHYGCMVDLLGRASLLKEAEELILSMKIAPDEATWGALLSACEKYGDSEMGERVGRKLIELHPDHDGFHVELSNMCALQKVNGMRF
ncbi:Pentatricopeptide repeat-containing protein [Drosera capensis]